MAGGTARARVAVGGIVTRRSETAIQRDIELALGSEPDLLVIRNSVGVARHHTDDGRAYTVPYGLGVGSPDLVGLLRGEDGQARWFCLEIKADGGRVSAEQEKCHRVWRSFGAFVAVVRSVDEARSALREARRR